MTNTLPVFLLIVKSVKNNFEPTPTLTVSEKDF